MTQEGKYPWVFEYISEFIWIRITVKRNNKNFKVRSILLVLSSVLIGLFTWGFQWATYARPPLPEAVEALESNDLVVVTQEPWLTFSPTNNTQKPDSSSILVAELIPGDIHP